MPLSDIICRFYLKSDQRNMFALHLLKLSFYSSCQDCHWEFSITIHLSARGYFYQSFTHAGQFSRHKSKGKIPKQSNGSRNAQGTSRFVAQCTRVHGKLEVAVNQKNVSRGFDTRSKFSIGRLRERVVSRFA